jgi:hypothetical protein
VGKRLTYAELTGKTMKPETGNSRPRNQSRSGTVLSDRGAAKESPKPSAWSAPVRVLRRLGAMRLYPFLISECGTASTAPRRIPESLERLWTFYHL